MEIECFFSFNALERINKYHDKIKEINCLYKMNKTTI
jgi:hypothetical protein